MNNDSNAKNISFNFDGTIISVTPNGFGNKLINLALLIMVVFFLFHSIASTVPVTSNAASITGFVSEYGIVSARHLGIQPDQAIYKITIFLESSEDISGMANLLKGKQGQELTLYTKERLSSDIFGKKIKAEVSYLGDERGGLWWIRSIKVFE